MRILVYMMHDNTRTKDKIRQICNKLAVKSVFINVTFDMICSNRAKTA